MKNNLKSLGAALVMGITIVTAVTTITGCAGDRYNRSTGEYIDDKSLNMRVKSALADNPEYKYDDVIVSSFRGTVQLSGFVNNAAQKSKAGDLAKTVQGVRNVENNITVKE